MARHAARFLTLTHAAAFAAGYVLLSYSNLPTPASGLWRPLVVALVAAVLLSLILGTITRNRALGALLATAAVLALSAAWLLVIVGIVAVTWIALVAVLRQRHRRPPLRWPGMTGANRLVGIFGGMFVLITAVSAAPAILRTFSYELPTAPPVAESPVGPSIFVVLLDGYPRSDVLRDHLGHDNAPFEGSLADLGFDVAAESRSNYTATWATLASMLHGTYLHEIEALTPFPEDQTEQYARLMDAINEGELLRTLDRHGYRTVTAPSPFEGVTLISANEVVGDGQLTFFELSLLQHSPLLGGILIVAPDFVLSQQRDRIESALAAMVDAAGTIQDGPTFMLIHLLSPHAPIVFDGTGDLADLPECFPAACTLWTMAEASQWSALPGQVSHLNQLVLNAVRTTVEVDPDAVVVLMSDHGMQPPNAPQGVSLNNFLAVRSPGRPGLIESDAHLVNVLPLIFDAYLGSGSQHRTYRGWFSAAEHPLDMVEVTPGG